MYDNVTFWIDRFEVGDEVFEGLRFFMKEGRDVGYMGNIRVEIVKNYSDPDQPPRSAKCSGSIPKWFEGSNIAAPTFGEVSHQINELCAMLQISADQARVTGVEFGSSYKVEHPPARYNELLWAYLKSLRHTHNKTRDVETVTFQSLAKKPTYCHTFYDKGAEVFHKNGERIDGYYLRYEVRFNRRLKSQLKWCGEGRITLETLQDPTFYTLLTEYYLSTFDKITKLTEMSGDCKIKTAGQGAERFFAQLSNIQLRSDPNAMKRYINSVKRHNPDISPQTLTRMRTKIRNVLSSTNSRKGEGRGMVAELEQKIRDECERCAPP